MIENAKIKKQYYREERGRMGRGEGGGKGEREKGERRGEGGKGGDHIQMIARYASTTGNVPNLMLSIV